MFKTILTLMSGVLFVVSVVGVVAGGVKSGAAMSRYSSGVRQAAEDTDPSRLEQIQNDQRTAPLEVAQGVAESALNAPTLAAPQPPLSAVPLGFHDALSVGGLASQATGELERKPGASAGEQDPFPFEGRTIQAKATKTWNRAHRVVESQVTIYLTNRNDSYAEFRLVWEDEDWPGALRVATGRLAFHDARILDNGADLEFEGRFRGAIDGPGGTAEEGRAYLTISVDRGFSQQELALPSDDYLALRPDSDFSPFDERANVSW